MLHRLADVLSRAPTPERGQRRRAVLVGFIVLCAAAWLVGLSVARAETGYASHYGHGDGFHGRRTASGQVMDKRAMTAAHRHRPFGSRVLVINLATGRAVSVVINDRGPAARTGKIIDLSHAAAMAIGCGGTCRVEVR